MIKKIIIGLLFILIAIQVVRIDKTNPAYEMEQDFMVMANPPEHVRQVLISACYDCHSFETKYPWYTNVAPFSWWIKNHINHGREELNFSEWGTYSEKRKNHKLDEVVELVNEGEMPLESYTWGHPEAKLTEEQKQELISWVKSQLK